MKNSLSENMLRFGTKNLSETAKQQIAYLNEQDPKLKKPVQKQGGNTNLFQKLILKVPIGKPGGQFAGSENKVVAGQIASFEMIMLKTTNDNPLPRYFAQFKKYPPILEIKVNGVNIAQKGKIYVKSQADGVLAGTFGLIGYADYANKVKSGDDAFKPMNDTMNKTFINPTVEKLFAGPNSGGASVIFDFGPTFINTTTASERFEQAPEQIQINGNPI